MKSYIVPFQEKLGRYENKRHDTYIWKRRVQLILKVKVTFWLI